MHKNVPKVAKHAKQKEDPCLAERRRKRKKKEEEEERKERKQKQKQTFHVRNRAIKKGGDDIMKL